MIAVVHEGLVAPWTEWERQCQNGRRLLEATLAYAAGTRGGQSFSMTTE